MKCKKCGETKYPPYKCKCEVNLKEESKMCRINVYATFEVETSGVDCREYDAYERLIDENIDSFMADQTKYKTDIEKAAFAECMRSVHWARIAANDPNRFKHSFISKEEES